MIWLSSKAVVVKAAVITAAVIVAKAAVTVAKAAVMVTLVKVVVTLVKVVVMVIVANAAAGVIAVLVNHTNNCRLAVASIVNVMDSFS
jgi:hypothetical protein